MTRIELLNWTKDNKSEWTYLIVLKNIVKDLLVEGSPLTIIEIQKLLGEAGHEVKNIALRDVVLRLVNQGYAEFDMGSPYIYYKPV